MRQRGCGEETRWNYLLQELETTSRSIGIEGGFLVGCFPSGSIFYRPWDYFMERLDTLGGMNMGLPNLPC